MYSTSILSSGDIILYPKREARMRFFRVFARAYYMSGDIFLLLSLSEPIISEIYLRVIICRDAKENARERVQCISAISLPCNVM